MLHTLSVTSSKNGVCIVSSNPKYKKFGIGGLAICALFVALMIPWAFHIGGRPTPLFWSGTGMLVTKTGTYPLYVLMYPTMERADGLQGWGSLCTSRNTITPLELDGRFHGGWWSLDHASMELDLLETQNASQTLFEPNNRGGLDLFGNWHGPELVLADHADTPGSLRSGLKFEHASVILKLARKSDFQTACSSMSTQLRK